MAAKTEAEAQAEAEAATTSADGTQPTHVCDCCFENAADERVDAERYLPKGTSFSERKYCQWSCFYLDVVKRFGAGSTIAYALRQELAKRGISCVLPPEPTGMKPRQQQQQQPQLCMLRLEPMQRDPPVSRFAACSSSPFSFPFDDE